MTGRLAGSERTGDTLETGIMLIRLDTLDGIRDGRITLAFRRWRRPTVRSGGTLLTKAGQLEIKAVTPVDPATITEAEARRAGHGSRAALVAQLDRRSDGEVYRVEFGRLLPDPRIALRKQIADDPRERTSLIEKLRRMDARASDGPWTRRALELIAAKPAVRAGDLCLDMGQERKAFKTNVRKLKKLGLTESLKTGYRLSPRGKSLLEAWAAHDAG